MSETWPHRIMEPFLIDGEANRYSYESPSSFNGAYGRFFHYLFDLSTPFKVNGPWGLPDTSPYVSDGAQQTPFRVYLDDRPVFFIDVKSAYLLEHSSDREQADARMRNYFRDFREQTKTPYLYGASAFGSRLCLYKYTRDTNTLEPSPLPDDLVVFDDTTPASRWDCDLVDAHGAARFREVIESVFQMCGVVKKW